LKHVGALWSGLAYSSRYNSGWFCHSSAPPCRRCTWPRSTPQLSTSPSANLLCAPSFQKLLSPSQDRVERLHDPLLPRGSRPQSPPGHARPNHWPLPYLAPVTLPLNPSCALPPHCSRPESPAPPAACSAVQHLCSIVGRSLRRTPAPAKARGSSASPTGSSPRHPPSTPARQALRFSRDAAVGKSARCCNCSPPVPLRSR
jgi:hypothetical protein